MFRMGKNRIITMKIFWKPVPSPNKRACCTTHRSIMKFQKDGVLIALNKLVIDI